jgi:hypothetical protein
MTMQMPAKQLWLFLPADAITSLGVAWRRGAEPSPLFPLGCHKFEIFISADMPRLVIQR